MVEAVKVKVREATVSGILENLLNYPDISITVDWENAFKIAGTRTTLNVLCNLCDTVSQRGASDLAMNKYRCNGCLVKKYRKCCADVGVDYMSHTSSKVTVQCRVCSTCISCNASELRMGYKPRCGTCLDRKYTLAAQAVGFNYLGNLVYKGQTSVNLRCPLDNAVFTASASSLLKNKVNCLECRINKYRSILYRKNCTFLQLLPANGRSSRIQYRNHRGDIFDALTCSITENSFATSLENHWREPHSTYIIVNKIRDNVYCKIGTARVPTKRLSDLKLIGDTDVITLATFEDRFEADALESSLHKEFRDYKLSPEISKQFSGKLLKRRKQDTAANTVVQDGIHEWFTHEVYDILKTRYNLTEGSANGSQFDSASTLTGTG